MKRGGYVIIVFGGAFNPPTKAHLEIYHHVQKELAPEKFIFLPVSSLYTKRSLASNQHRLQMLRLMIDGLDNAEISTIEFDDSDYSGTYQSLIRLQEHYPNQELCFLVGADNLPTLDKWINANSLLTEFRFVVVNRRENDILRTIREHPFLKEHEKQFLILPDFNIDVSSTVFRATFDQKMVTQPVFEYIQAHGLYRG